MKIYFACTTAEFNKYKHLYFLIRDYIVETGNVLTRDWLSEVNERVSKKNFNVENIEKVYKDSVKALRDADLLIMEDSISSFSTGHLITMAIQLHKPTLVMWHESKNKTFKKMFINGITSEYLQIVEYNEKNYKTLIDQFIQKYSNFSNNNRFNLVLNNFEREYLDWIQYNKKISRTKYIKKLINEDIQNNEGFNEFFFGK